MRIAIVLSLLLALTGEARADVFVPDDPPPLPKAGGCSAAAGDLVVAETGATLVVSTAGGPWQAVPGLNGCPVVAAASDGTAAIAATDAHVGGTVLVVRRPGGTFGAPVALGSLEPSVAVAPGGWAAMAGVESAGRSVIAMIVRPDGTTARTVLDRAADDRRRPENLLHPQVAIDAGGNATVVWGHSSSAKTRLRTARATAGGPAVLSGDLPGEPSGGNAFAVAGAPGGRTLLAWATDDGLWAMIGGEPPQRVDATTSVSRPTASIADDGAAVIAYSSSSGEIIAVDRAPGAAWALPRVLAAPVRSDDSLREPAAPLSMIEPGGRALVAWFARREDVLSVAATVGQAGGAWAPATSLSAITRNAWPVGVTLTAIGAPRVLWLEIGRGIFGATLGIAPADTTPPSVIASWPRRVAPTRTGRIAVAVRVRCSEACDVLFEATARGGVGGGQVARAVAPGRVATLRLPSGPELERELLYNPRSRRVRLDLLVTDRAGNVERRTRTVRIRVIERPLRELKVAADHDFGMSSAAGNRAVASLVNEVIELAAAHRGGDTLRRHFRSGVAAVRRAGHKEIGREAARMEIYRALELPLTRAGHDPDLVVSS